MLMRAPDDSVAFAQPRQDSLLMALPMTFATKTETKPLLSGSRPLRLPCSQIGSVNYCDSTIRRSRSNQWRAELHALLHRASPARHQPIKSTPHAGPCRALFSVPDNYTPSLM